MELPVPGLLPRLDRRRRAKPRTQASLAVSADGKTWILLNASPGLARAVARRRRRCSRAKARCARQSDRAVVLTGAEVDQVAGLLTLRERQEFSVFATAETLAALAANPIFGVLAADLVTRKAVARRAQFCAARRHRSRAVRRSRQGRALSRRRRSRACCRNRRQCRRRTDLRRPAAGLCTGRRRRNGRLCARGSPAPTSCCSTARCFVDDEMIVTGTGGKTGRRMGHMPVDGEDGTLAALAGLPGRAHFDPYQQHQSDPDRGFRRTAQGRGRRLRDRRGRDGDRAVNAV